MSSPRLQLVNVLLKNTEGFPSVNIETGISTVDISLGGGATKYVTVNQILGIP